MFGRKKKKSFLEKITGGIHVDDFDDDLEDEDDARQSSTNKHRGGSSRKLSIEDEFDDGMIQNEIIEEIPQEGQLSVDVLNDTNEIIIKTMIAGVKPSDIDVDISRDMVIIRGTRHEEHASSSSNYHCQELYWGTFSRTIILPEEVDVDASKAKEKHGVLTIRLPKVDKHKKTKLKVDSVD